MSIYPQQNIYPQKNPSSMDYDLQSEKQRIAEATEEIKKELLEKWQKQYKNAQIFPPSLAAINPELINFLLSFQNTLFYTEIAKKFNFNQPQRDRLPKIVWYICLNKKWEALKASIINDLSVDPAIADQIINLLNQNILLKARELSDKLFAPKNNFAPAQKEDSLNHTVSLSINDALKQYPELGEQLITSEKITLKTFPDPVRPSIKNWLSDYTFTMGHDHKGAIERGNYLFQSINGRRLSSAERQKLSYILKAYDENSQITIDKNLKQLVFPAINSTPSKPSVAQVSNSGFPIANQIPKSNTQNLKSADNLAMPKRESIRNNNYDISQLKNSGIVKTPAGSRNDSYKISQVKDAPPGSLPSKETELPTRGSVSFSSPQRLPFEKERMQAIPPTAPRTASAPQAKPATQPTMPNIHTSRTAPTPQPKKLQPLRISPFFRSSETENAEEKNSGTPSKNVVNLKE